MSNITCVQPSVIFLDDLHPRYLGKSLPVTGIMWVVRGYFGGEVKFNGMVDILKIKN
ncbi:hypothetical protein [Peribacillus sp. NPDC058002]|uniref:hypothetical protein n=1 Tax=Peribacillus sp. NPDC058002 TaxID=3346301 RepID=UPI0036DC38C8